MDLVCLRMLSFVFVFFIFFINFFFFFLERNVGLLIGCFILRLEVNFGVCTSPVTRCMPFCQQVHFTHSHNISKWHPGSRGGGG